MKKSLYIALCCLSAYSLGMAVGPRIKRTISPRAKENQPRIYPKTEKSMLPEPASLVSLIRINTNPPVWKTNVVIGWSYTNQGSEIVFNVYSNNILNHPSNWHIVATVQTLKYTNKNDFKLGAKYFTVTASNISTHLESIFPRK